MRKVLIFSGLLILGLVGSQVVGQWTGAGHEQWALAVRLLTMLGLSFIMIHVGFEFEIDRSRPRVYAKDYGVAATAAAFPWLLCALYFVFVMVAPSSRWSGQTWTDVLLAARFAAPTSAGVLFSMLAAAGLGATWLFRKARILAIFDDLDTVLLLIPLQIMIIGFRAELLVGVGLMVAMLWLGWRYLHAVRLPVTWPWVLGYSTLIVLVSEWLAHGTGVHLEVLLPAFVAGCVLARPAGIDPHADDATEGHLDAPPGKGEQRAATIISGAFMVLVGLSMPVMFGPVADQIDAGHLAAVTPETSWAMIALHVGAITMLSNIGKMFATLTYRDEAGWRERLALGIGLWPRGEVGAGVLVLSLSYGIGGPVVIVAMLSLALNLLLTGVFIAIIRHLLIARPTGEAAAQPWPSGELYPPPTR